MPAPIWILGWVSLLTDISSEMILAELPVYFGIVMSVSMAMIGPLLPVTILGASRDNFQLLFRAALVPGMLATLIVDSVHETLRGIAFGVFSLLSGPALVASGALGGLVWDIWGPSTLFWLATAAATLSLATARKP